MIHALVELNANAAHLLKNAPLAHANALQENLVYAQVKKMLVALKIEAKN